MQGKIIKGIAGFYYVAVESELYECKAKVMESMDYLQSLLNNVSEKIK